MIKHMTQDLKTMGIHTINLRTDNAGYYHSASVMATVSTIMQTTGVRIATWSFSEAQSGKSSADRYAAYCKTIMRNYMSKGKNIENHDDMFIALTSGKGLRGMSVHLMSVDFTPQPKTTLEGISKLGHFEFQGDTIHAWRFRGIGKGMSKSRLTGIVSSATFHNHGGKLSRSGLKTEDEQKIRNGEEPHYWFFPTTKITTPEPDDVDDEAASGIAPTPIDASSPKSLFVCNQCSSTFIRHASLLRHLDVGRHKIRPEKISMYDFALGTFKRVLEEVQQGVGIVLPESFKEFTEAPKNPRPKGWALRSTKKTGRYDPVARKLVDDLFEQYFSNGKKLRPDEAEKKMRERNDILPAQRMTFDQIRNRITTLLSQKKEHQRKEHGNRQRRYVKLIDDFERDLAEEGMSLDDIEEEVDLERPLDEDDLIITSDEIYDLVHSNMEFFDNPSEPVFSDFGEFEQ
ncbi:hypothetical protein PRIPAC_72188 [Pristionchus pacificus]|uniref:C2H2-type domain-containing protein n=1 Tax=Pristionchus pacificus TaxID=54126 RepID=A0A454XLU7_PRIPA|nr:hypothetical protein PRIPAC_72188 [Pristionchus pacificus]|eukprot:PDM73643.1 hypothetical protein PRIPAC_40999 [Pristionchus pacificus]